mgnify:CR=1 FL=1|tara:strand:- start:2369 stop:2734 length:366 start_codon:yes stop_codon:yes gene_type:complete
MESDSGRHQSPQGPTDTAQQVLCERTRVGALQGDTTQEIWQRHTRVHGRTVDADRGDIQEPSGIDSTVALDKLYINQTRHIRLVDDWMNPWPIPGEDFLNNIKEKYETLKKRLLSKTDEDC